MLQCDCAKLCAPTMTCSANSMQDVACVAPGPPETPSQQPCLLQPRCCDNRVAQPQLSPALSPMGVAESLKTRSEHSTLAGIAGSG